LQQSVKPLKRIVVKIGSSLFYQRRGELNLGFVDKIAAQVSVLLESGKEVIIVSSGAIALGMHKLNFSQRPKELSKLSAAAAVGQTDLMNTYSRAFGERFRVAQILLTRDDFNCRQRYLNAKNTIEALLKSGNVVPIINENDTVSTDEIKFGDNDRLSALVSSLVAADLLIILSDVDGLLEKDKKTIVRVVDDITPQVKSLASPTDKKTSVGGMITKLDAAKIATGSGIPCVITNGRHKDIILSVIKEPGKCGTLFLPKKYLAARERWIAFGTKPKGKIMVDEGAKNALKAKKSLLSVGVIALEGIFENNDIVSVIDQQNAEFARGKVGLSSKQLEKVKGSRCEKEIIHRDNIVIL